MENDKQEYIIEEGREKRKEKPKTRKEISNAEKKETDIGKKLSDLCLEKSESGF